MSQISRALKLIRQYHNVSIEKLAEDLEVQETLIERVESGQNIITYNLIELYSKKFDIPVSSLVFFSEHIDNGKISSKFRKFASEKILNLMEWLVSKNKELEHGK